MPSDHRLRQVKILAIAFLANQLINAVPRCALAAWPISGVPLNVTTAEDPQQALTTDGSSGVIVTWTNYDDDYDVNRVFVQRISAAGGLHWTISGVPVTTTYGSQDNPVIASDGAGGAYVAWAERRGGTSSALRVYIQRFDPHGSPLWQDNGIPVLDVADQGSPTLVADDQGGCIVTWSDGQSLTAQRFDHNGDKQWAPDGISLCSGCWTTGEFVSVPDGASGAILTWVNDEYGYQRLFAQRVISSGEVVWVPGGVLLSASESMKFVPKIATDGGGGAFISWSDYDSGESRALIQHVNPGGAATWLPNGYRISDEDTWQSLPSPVEDGIGGVIVVWQEYENLSPFSLHAQRLNQLGEKQWAPEGIPVCDAPGNRGRASAHSDENGGAIVLFLDDQIATGNVSAQRLGPNGEQLWPQNGIAFGAGWLGDHGPTAISDGAGGSLIIRQVATPTWRELYVHRVTSTGDAPVSVPGKSHSSSLFMGSATPNPFSSTTFFDLEVGAETNVTVDVYDVMGARVWNTRLTGHLNGSHGFHFEGRGYAGQPLPSGVYFCRVRAAGETITRKMVIAR